MADTSGYGATEETKKQLVKGSRLFIPGKRHRINAVPIALNVVIPWALFVFISYILSSDYHYYFESRAWMCVIGAFLFALSLAYLAYRRRVRDRDPAWFTFCAVTCLLACIAAVIAGDYQFNMYMLPYYEIQNLNTYPSVNPARETGSQMLDAGKVYFAEGAGLDLHRAIAFRSGDLYCAAPIVSGEELLSTYDFWAVGINCCSGVSADYRCGQFDNPYARSGLRLMREDWRRYFHLAVKQAEAAYGLRATFPLFFYWIQDPVKEVNLYLRLGTKAWYVGILVHLGCQIFAVLICLVFFSRAGRL